VSEILDRVGSGGIAVDVPLDPAADHVVKAYLVYDHAARFKVRRVKEAIGRLRAFGLGPVGAVEVRRIADEDWLEAWKASFTPIRIGRFLVRPTWSDAPPGDATVIELDPGMAFGTGLHPTTRQCLEALGARELEGRSVLDVGTGSGILAIAAAKRGARPVVGVDTDPLAVRAATENCARNEVRVDVRQGSAGDVEGRYDVVLANLVADVLIAAARDLHERVATGGTLIAAGIIGEREQSVVDAFRGVGLAVAGRDQEGDWVRLDVALMGGPAAARPR
jgi:ribosomal protein L11 methyltransferase